MDALGGRELFISRLTSGFNAASGIRGSVPKDLWFAVSNVANEDVFERMPQVFGIVSPSGIEIGFAAAIHPSDFSQREIKERVREAAPRIFKRLPAGTDEIAIQLQHALAENGGWHYRRKTRLQPDISDFETLVEWMAFLSSPEGAEWAGGSISKYFGPTMLDDEAFDLDSEVQRAAHLFEPLMRSLTPASEASSRTPANADDMPEPQVGHRVWIWAPGQQARYWDELFESGLIAIGWDALGDLRQYVSIEQFKAALARSYEDRGDDQINNGKSCYDFTYSMMPGDIVYAKAGLKTILGKGIVEGDYNYDPARQVYKNTRKVRWTHTGEWTFDNGNLPVKTLTEWTRYPDAISGLERLLAGGGRDDVRRPPVRPTEREKYSIEDALDSLFVEPSAFNQILETWQAKKNLIIQGPPGVGKSFVARRLAYTLMGYKDPSRVRTVQFHQSFSYEHFVQGYRPHKEGGFRLHEGVFTDFCRLALDDAEQRYVFIIDEINRGNVSRILGELMLLIEGDKRAPEWAIKLAHSDSADERFYVPPNVFILGMITRLIAVSR